MKRLRYARLLFVLILLIVAAMLGHGCKSDSKNTLTNLDSSQTVIVEKGNPNAVAPPCGTIDAVCGSITDGLAAAAMLDINLPTVLVRPGTYNAEPAYPIQINSPVLLRSEHTGKAIIQSPAALWDSAKRTITLDVPVNRASPRPYEFIPSTISIQAPNVTIEGFDLVSEESSHYLRVPIVVTVDGGEAVLRSNTFRSIFDGESSGLAMAVMIENGGHATMKNNTVIALHGIRVGSESASASAELYDNDISSNSAIWGRGARLHLVRNAIRGYVGSIGGSMFAHKNVMRGRIDIYDDVEATVTENTIHYGGMSLRGGNFNVTAKDNVIHNGGVFITTDNVSKSGFVLLENNTIIKTADENGGALEISAGNGIIEARLINNMISGKYRALWLEDNRRRGGVRRVFLSRNRFNSENANAPVILCEGHYTVTTDGTNSLVNPARKVSCAGLPSEPGKAPF